MSLDPTKTMAEHDQLIKKLIETKSLSGQEDQIRGVIESWFRERGIETIKQDRNLLVHIQGEDSSKAFIINSHMDTVGPGEDYDKNWKNDPWTPTQEGDRLYGLGASDMKSGLAASMMLASEYTEEIPPVDMWFTYVVMEEVDGSGSAPFAEWFEKEGYTRQYQDMAGIFTEPTGLSEVEHGHRGNLFLKVTSNGDSGHASRPEELGVHSVRKMIEFADSLNKAVEKWKEEFPSEFFNPTITLGEFTSINAGNLAKPEIDGEGKIIAKIQTDSPNKFPQVCTATFDLRTIASFHPQALERIQTLGEEYDVSVSLLYPDAPAGFTDPSEKIVKTAQAVLGPETKLTTSQGSADLGFLTTKGVEAIILGPGDKHIVHKANEYCLPDQIPQAVDIYKAIVEGWAQ